MFSPPDALIESELRASLDHWRGFLLIAALWTSIGFVVPLYFTHHLHLELTREAELTVWSLIAGIGVIANWISVRRMYFAVMPGQLQIGRSPHETIVEFSEIESLVVGLPPDQSRLARIARFDHTTAGARIVVAQMRREAVFIRLHSGHYLALYISTFWFANADALKSTLLQRNREKLIGADSYTPEEVKSLARVYFNRVK
jgi:hypothetical protein